MHLKRSFAVIGGDLRQRSLLRQLREAGLPFRVPRAGCGGQRAGLIRLLTGCERSDFAMPAGGGVPLADILDAAEPGALICGGMLDPARRSCRRAGSHFMTMRRTRRCCCKRGADRRSSACAAAGTASRPARRKPDPALRLWAHRKAAGAQAESAWRGRDRLGAEGAGSGACAHSRLSPRHGRKLGRRARAVRRDRQHRSRTDHRPGAAAMHPPGLRAAGACQPARRVLRRGAGASGVLRRAWSSGQIRAGGCRRHHPKRHIP